MMRTLALLLPLAMLALSAPAGGGIAAQPRAPFHPAVKLLDAAGNSVVAGGGPLSPMRTCGECHDAQYIVQHSYHANAGLDELTAPGGFPGARPWDISPGWFGRWEPLTYRLPLAADGASWLDRAAWVRQLGFRHAGGGPAVFSGGAQAELNCFLCHTEAPDNAARIAELAAGRSGWAATATLAPTGLVARNAAGWQWDRTAIAVDGTVSAAQLTLGAPRSENCGLCHGAVYSGNAPLQLDYGLGNWSTETTGQVYSAQRLNASALNLRGKDGLARPWDIHAERLLTCGNCHYALNNPAYSATAQTTKSASVLFDPRKLNLGEYLQKPRHGFAKGDSAQGLVAAASDNSMRGCAGCHTAERTHSAWLPYARRHLSALSCEACHIPRIYAPARSLTDWTVLLPGGQPRVEYRGGTDGALTRANIADPSQLLTGYQPVLLPRHAPGGGQQLIPFNIIVSWYWVCDAGPSAAPATALPVSREQLQAALMPGGTHGEAVLAALDTDRDGRLSDIELRLDTPAKAEAIATVLRDAGVANPRIAGELAPYDLHHATATAEWAVRDCSECHRRQGRTSTPLLLSSYVPAGVIPGLVAEESVSLAGRLRRDSQGGLTYQPSSAAAGLYVLGHDRWLLGDRLGLAAVWLALLLAAGHGVLRIALALRRRSRSAR